MAFCIGSGLVRPHCNLKVALDYFHFSHPMPVGKKKSVTFLFNWLCMQPMLLLVQSYAGKKNAENARRTVLGQHRQDVD